ncbi:hypothetical protein R3P38DRAFT_3360879, partial [Favolaschia claudopus]
MTEAHAAIRVGGGFLPAGGQNSGEKRAEMNFERREENGVNVQKKAPEVGDGGRKERRGNGVVMDQATYLFRDSIKTSTNRITVDAAMCPRPVTLIIGPASNDLRRRPRAKISRVATDRGYSASEASESRPVLTVSQAAHAALTQRWAGPDKMKEEEDEENVAEIPNIGFYHHHRHPRARCFAALTTQEHPQNGKTGTCAHFRKSPSGWLPPSENDSEYTVPVAK